MPVYPKNPPVGAASVMGLVMKVLAHDDDPFWLWHNIFSQTNNSKHPVTSVQSQYYWMPFQMSEQKMDMTQP